MKKFITTHRALIIILSIAIAVRFYALGIIPVGMYIDETAIGIDAFLISQTGKDMHQESALRPMYLSYGDYKLPGYILLDSLSIKLFGKNEFAVRFPSAVAGVLSVLLVYGISLELFSTHKKRTTIAIFTALFTALMPWSILFSRTGFEGHLAQMFVLCMVFFALKSQQRPYYAIGSALFSIFGMYTYFSVRYIAPVLYLAIAFLIMYRSKKISGFLWFLAGGFLMILFYLPMLRSPLYPASQQFRLSAENLLSQKQLYVATANSLREVDAYSIVSRLFHHRMIYFTKDLAKNIFSHADLSYIFFSGDHNLRHSTGEIGLLLPVTLLPFFIGIYALMRIYKDIGILLLVWWGISVLPASIPLEVPHALRSLNGLGVFALILGIGTYEFYYWITHKTKNGKLYVFLYSVFFLINLFLFFQDYLYYYPIRSAKAWSDGNKQAAYAVSTAKDTHTQVFTISSEKLFLWYLFYGDVSVREIQEAIEARSTNYDSFEIQNIAFNKTGWQTKIHESASYILGPLEMIGMEKTGEIPSVAGIKKYVYVETK